MLHDAGRATGLALADGTRISGDQVVLACGAATQRLIDGVDDLNVRIPRLVHGHGVSVVVRTAAGTPPARSVLRTPNRSFACGLHLVPRSSGTVYLGATNAIHFDEPAGPGIDDVTFLLGCAVHQLDRRLRVASVERLQSGSRPASFDGFPLIGETSLAGLWLASGTYRDGLHLSPLVAGYLTERLQGKGAPDDLDAFRPERPPIQAFTREEIVDQAGQHILASGYERNWTLPLDWPAVLDELFRDRHLTFAYALSDRYTPPPEILVALLRAPADVRDRYRRHLRRVRDAWS
ncbi:hypothetical protein GCM10009558_098870 [Virgisporangium aurantiacum]